MTAIIFFPVEVVDWRVSSLGGRRRDCPITARTYQGQLPRVTRGELGTSFRPAAIARQLPVH